MYDPFWVNFLYLVWGRGTTSFFCLWISSFQEKAMSAHSSTLVWRIPWTEEPGRLWSMGLLRVGHDWATSLSLFSVMHWRRKWQPTPVFLPGENPRDGEAWWAAVYGVAQSWTRLKWLSSSSSSIQFSQLHLLKTLLFPRWMVLKTFSKINWP